MLLRGQQPVQAGQVSAGHIVSFGYILNCTTHETKQRHDGENRIADARLLSPAQFSVHFDVGVGLNFVYLRLFLRADGHNLFILPVAFPVEEINMFIKMQICCVYRKNSTRN